MPSSMGNALAALLPQANNGAARAAPAAEAPSTFASVFTPSFFNSSPPQARSPNAPANSMGGYNRGGRPAYGL